LKFPAIGSAKIEFVAGEANGNGVPGLPFAGGVVVSACRFVFPGIDDAVEVHHDGAADRVGG
jgi:hypothetical protein